jgi:hypothetical protein
VLFWEYNWKLNGQEEEIAKNYWKTFGVMDRFIISLVVRISRLIF